jgi:hypothetical protein
MPNQSRRNTMRQVALVYEESGWKSGMEKQVHEQCQVVWNIYLHFHEFLAADSCLLVVYTAKTALF